MVRKAHATLESLESDTALHDVLETAVLEGSIDNMKCERLIALTRAYGASGQKGRKATADSLIAKGLMGQILKVHLASDGLDPRGQSRELLTSQGVPLMANRRALKAKNNNKHTPANLRYLVERKNSWAPPQPERIL